MIYKCLIVDDEPIAQNIVKGFVSDTPNIEVYAVCDNAIQALKILQEAPIDLLFLDIELPKISGLEFLKTLANPPATIITTAYREFALDGYELNVVDYLLKPFSFERFLKAINKSKANIAVRQVRKTIANPYKTFEYFKVDRKNIKVYYDDILYIEGLSNYVKIYFKDKFLVVYHKLIDLERTLPHNQFARIHKSHIISLKNIRAYGSDYVEVADRQLSIGNTYKESFFSAINVRIN